MINVVIVDEHPLFIDGLKKVLGCRPERFNLVGEFHSPKKALREISERKVDLILMDLMPPQHHGLDFIKEIKLICTNVKIIVLSGSADLKIQRSARKAGIHGLLLKQCCAVDLFNTVDRVLDY